MAVAAREYKIVDGVCYFVSLITVSLQFSHRYTVLSELGRGRCAVVKLARDTGTGQLVASKQISRNLQALIKTQAEYKIISAITHSNVVKGLCLYQNAPHPGTDTIVME